MTLPGDCPTFGGDCEHRRRDTEQCRGARAVEPRSSSAALRNKGSICNSPSVWLFVYESEVENLPSISVWFFYCCDKDHVQKQLEEERVYFILKFPQSIAEGRQSTWEECHILASSVCFLTHSRTSSPWVALPTVGWAFCVDHQLKYFLNWASLFSDDSSLC